MPTPCAGAGPPPPFGSPAPPELADDDARPPFRVGLGLADQVVNQQRDLALAEEEEADDRLE
jgi:hypothetical protein